jgi:hypothetical protein
VKGSRNRRVGKKLKELFSCDRDIAFNSELALDRMSAIGQSRPKQGGEANAAYVDRIS